ncbi:MAG: BadF/BadG/BcrA/BcrD type ATPase [Anaerolineae bacterium]|nr:BadF/BadG/BcrA/BcrD type ATPase [Anaerolineae bacterium]
MKRWAVVGVDGGGTKTLALAASVDGQWQGRGLAGPSNLHSVGFESACTAIEYAISEALAGANLLALCLGLAGAGRKDDVDRFIAWAQVKYPGVALKVLSDAEILLASGNLSGPALALICGTGSIVYGRTAAGELLRAGGWGYLFGDEGSGYAIGAAALRAVMQAEDGRGVPTLLTGLILDRYGLENPPTLVQSIYGSESPRTEIAGLADLVEQAALRGDTIAISILETAAVDLARMVQVVYQKLEGVPTPLALTGGVILRGEYLANTFRQACETMELVFLTVLEVAEPAEEAALIARSLIA